MRFNYEVIEEVKLSKLNENYTRLPTDQAVQAIYSAYSDGNIIMFERNSVYKTCVYITGVEHNKEDGFHFVKLDENNFPEEIIGGVYDVIEMMDKEYVDYFWILEVE